MPETYGDMIACDNCGDWYNMECVGLKRSPPKQEQWNTVWSETNTSTWLQFLHEFSGSPKNSTKQW